jgi:hypothetical protein
MNPGTIALRVAAACVLAVPLTLAVIPASQAAPRPDTTPGLTLNGPTTLNGQTTINMDASHPGLRIKGHEGSLAQPLQVFDFLGNPIFDVGSVGGAAVTGDNLSVFPPGDVFTPVIVLRLDGSITLGGPAGPTLYGGPGDPNTAPPVHVLPFEAGDRYLSTSGLFATWVFTGAAWVVQ